MEKDNGLGQKSDETPTLPHNYDLEQAFLSILMHHNGVLEEVEDFLTAEDFFHPAHTAIFRTIHGLLHQGHRITPTLVAQYVEKDLEAVGGKDYLLSLGQLLISTALGPTYAQEIHTLALRRKLITLGDTIALKARQCSIDDAPVPQQIEEAEQTLFSLSDHGKNQGFSTLTHALTKAVETATLAQARDSHVVGVSTGFLDINRQLGGLHPSDLLVLAARPGMGKTALATTIALKAAEEWQRSQGKDGAPVAVFSLEMSAEQLALRLISQVSAIDSTSLRCGRVKQGDLASALKASQTLASLKIFIDDTPGLTVSLMRSRARRLKRRENIGLIVVDYLQLIRAPHRTNDGRVQELSEITRHLKILAKELQVPVLALSQLSRAVEQREDKRPLLSDLRESGSIEQDADVVMFIYREDYYKKNEEKNHRADLIIAKQRHGPLTTIPLHFEGKFTKFSNWEDSTPHA